MKEIFLSKPGGFYAKPITWLEIQSVYAILHTAGAGNKTIHLTLGTAAL